VTTTHSLHEADPTTVQEWLARGEAVLVDVREPFEFASERIAGAVLHPLGSFDPTRVERIEGKRVVLCCRTGRRSATAAEKWLEAGYTEAIHLSGGLMAWKEASLPLEHSKKAPLDLMRQVQLSAGALILFGIVGGLLLTPWLLGLSAFVGAGLAFAGASGYCGMARALAVMPWNRGFEIKKTPSNRPAQTRTA